MSSKLFEHGLWIVAAYLFLTAGISKGETSTQEFFEFNMLSAVPSVEPSASVELGGMVYSIESGKLVCVASEDEAAEPVVCGDSPELDESAILAVLGKKVYVAGVGPEGIDTFSFYPKDASWSALSVSGFDMRGFVGAACGKSHSHILFLNASEADRRIIAYHSIYDRWIEIGQLPEAVQVVSVKADSKDENKLTAYTGAGAIEITAKLLPTKYHWVNHLVVAALLIAILSIGAVMARREKSAGDYFRAGSRIPWWAAGLSMFAAMASAISLMAMPSNGFSENWIYFSISIFTVLIQLPILLVYYVPLARRLKVSTANEYLERRYGLPARMLGFVFFTLTQVLIRVGSILLLPSLALNSIFGLPLQTCILIMGGVTMLFVTLGGLEAVVWADVLQAVVMVSAIVICALWALFSLDMVPSEAMAILDQFDKLQLFDWRMDLSQPVVIVLAANILAFALGLIGDQNFIQRVQCTQNEKESRKAMITQLAIAVPLNLILFTLGTLLFLYYFNKPQILSPAMDSQGVFPFFAAQNLPPGLPGVVVAALLAATMSTVAGALNSVANLGVEDVYRRFNKNASDHSALMLGRILTISFGLIGTGFALWCSYKPMGSVWNLTFKLMGAVTAPLTGMYVLGIFSKRANYIGIWVGALVSVGAYFYAKDHMDLNALAYLPFCMLVSIVVGYVASLIIPAKQKDLTGLTAYTLLDKEADG
ncbi:MAG: sodium:solute symporter [Pontiellaceae bacterium]|nr:sodium:solute symporter [Pontiellaceae bacterium]MBN2786176.1 sodium:solute symporter [Pontiellaceae bacterium]